MECCSWKGAHMHGFDVGHKVVLIGLFRIPPIYKFGPGNKTRRDFLTVYLNPNCTAPALNKRNKYVPRAQAVLLSVLLRVEFIEVEEADSAKFARVRAAVFAAYRLPILNARLWQNRTTSQNGIKAIWMGCVPQPTAKLRQDKVLHQPPCHPFTYVLLACPQLQLVYVMFPILWLVQLTLGLLGTMGGTT